MQRMQRAADGLTPPRRAASAPAQASQAAGSPASLLSPAARRPQEAGRQLLPHRPRPLPPSREAHAAAGQTPLSSPHGSCKPHAARCRCSALPHCRLQSPTRVTSKSSSMAFMSMACGGGRTCSQLARGSALTTTTTRLM